MPVKRYSTSLAIKKLQIKITVKHHFTLMSIAIARKT